MPKLAKHEKQLKKGGKFDGVTLLAGWIPKKNDEGYTWTKRDKKDIVKEHSAYV